MNVLDKEQIKSFLPHREPMLLIDEAIVDENDLTVAHAKYKIKDDEFFTRGHFPGNPIVPGVIQCEIMAQSCAVLVKDEIPGNITLYAGLDKVRFKNTVHPGDVCEITAKLNNPNSTVGRLINDPRVYDHLDSTMTNASKLLEDLRLNPKRYVHF